MTFFAYVIIFVVILIILIFIFTNFFLPKIRKKEIIKDLTQYLQKSNIEHSLLLTNDKLYDLELLINGKKFAIKLLHIPLDAEVQINNRSTWEVKYGAGSTPGKAQPHKRYLTEISSFQAKNFDQDIIKIVLVYPKPKKIVKYINENEIVFVNSKTDVYGTRIITRSSFNVFIEK